MNDNDKKLLQQTVNDLNANITNNRNAIQLLVQAIQKSNDIQQDI